MATDELIRKVLASTGERLRGLRASRGISQFEFAEGIGMAPEAYGRLERGVSTPTLETLLKVCAAYGVSLDDLVGWSEKDVEEVARDAAVQDLVAAIARLPVRALRVVDVLVSYLLDQEKARHGPEA